MKATIFCVILTAVLALAATCAVAEQRGTPGNTPAQGAASASVQSNRTSGSATDWRYRYCEGRWWYWLPENRWVYHNGSGWVPYVPGSLPTSAYPYTAAYGGEVMPGAFAAPATALPMPAMNYAAPAYGGPRSNSGWPGASVGTRAGAINFGF